MFPLLVPLLRAQRALILDRLVRDLLDAVPRYEVMQSSTLRDSLGGLLDLLVVAIETGERTPLRDRFAAVAERRAAQGFTPADYLRAIFVVPRSIERTLRDQANEDPALKGELDAIGPTMRDLAAIAGNLFVDQIGRQLHARNAELHRVNQQLQAQQRAMQLEVGEMHQALARANEFNHRVVESLTSGVMVIEANTTRVTMFTTRMEEIFERNADDVMGRPVHEALAGIQGADVQGMTEQVRIAGSAPLTKLALTLPAGRRKAIYARARALLDEEGVRVGTVVIVDDITEKELLLESFSRYVSRDLVARLLARAEPMALDGERRTTTILFADIRGFTALAEGHTPEEVHALLNTYFRLMIDAILQEGGFIDKFVGDKVMALFTHGVDDSVHAAAALRAALAIKRALRALNDERRAHGEEAIEVGIGVNTGPVMLGNIGSDARMEFTAIGDPVNVADRLQGMARGAEIYVGEDTVALVGGRFACVDRGDQPVRGRQRVARVYELRVDDVERPAEAGAAGKTDR